MSKRSTRRKRREKQKQKSRLSLSGWIQRGNQAFQQANYSEAIGAWEQARNKPNVPNNLSAGLAEAYFRYALNAPATTLDSLQQAVRLQPADQCYRYHLALAYHRQGELAKAEPLYRRLVAETPPYKRAVMPLAQLLVEQGKGVSKDPVWQQLSIAEQAQLAAAEALIQKKAASTRLGLLEKPLDPLWRGLLALTMQDYATARSTLGAAVETANSLHPLACGVAHYYLGIIAVEAGQLEAALAHWQTARSKGLNSSHLRQNLAALIYEQAVKAQQSGQPQQAADLLEQTDFTGDDLKDFYRQLNLELGYTAAQKGNWAQALALWQKAEQSGDNSRGLIFNLALAYQKQEHYRRAAEYWRTLLRRRPRKANHPDALTDQQVARIWQNIAENYSQAGDYDEAITTYKNAVKWAPDNIDLRLKLVETYQGEGRWQAAENELHRILEKAPDHVPALTLLAESYSGDYFPGRARKIWFRILELEPQNPVARQQLAHTYEKEGLSFTFWGRHQQAIDIFKEGLKHVPDNQRLLTIMGGTYSDWGELKQARQYLEQALAVNPNDLQTLHTIYVLWLEHNSPKDLQHIFEQIKAIKLPIPGAFFLDLFERCQQFNQNKAGQKILEYAEQRYSDDEDALVGIAKAYMDLEQDNKALSILRRVLKINPDHIEANIEVGVLYHYMDQVRLARRHWDKAQAQAHKENNPILAHRVKLVKDEFLHGKPPPSNPLDMFMNLPPNVRDEMLKQAPPEVAEMLRDPEMVEMMFSFGGMGGFDDDFFFDDEDEFYV